MRGLTLILCLLASVAQAQIGLPPVRLPSTPLPGATQLPALGEPLDVARSAADVQGRLRRLQIRALLRAHRDVLEEDPRGDPIVRGEVLLLNPSEESSQRARAAGFTPLRTSSWPQLDLTVVVLRAPSGTARSLGRLTTQDPAAAYDFNHIYTVSGELGAAAAAREPGVASDAPARVTVGLIDSGVDVRHEALSAAHIESHGCGGRIVPAAHGTAVASLLVARSSALQGAAPGAALYAADVYCDLPQGGAVDAIVEAFAWLVQQRVPVINVSLVGPPNRLLEQVVQRVLARGHLIVAAVGNDGPAAPPLYPAAWPGVVGVTAVDAQGRVLVEAQRGAQVRLAAPGADLAAARSPSGYVLVRGTSFAAPIVAGLLAQRLTSIDPSAAAAALSELEHGAHTAGGATPNPVYGYGLVGVELREQPALRTLRKD